MEKRSTTGQQFEQHQILSPNRRSLSRFIQAFTLISLLTYPTIKAETLPITGLPDSRLASFDALMTEFVQDRRVPGGSLAIARNGRLIYARGFGWANEKKGEAVRPDSRFRIASISKPITAAAVLKLAQEGKLDLSSRAWHQLPESARPADDLVADERVRAITIQQLLHHTAGFDRQVSFDPMFRPRQIAQALGLNTRPTASEILRYTLARSLDFSPGSRYAYSNVGYNALGRIIEETTQQSYQQYCQEHILRPLGITGMQLGNTLAKGRAPGEVHYSSQGKKARSVFGPEENAERVPLAYGAWDLEAMDAHGGWIASAPELVRFGEYLLRSDLSPLSQASLNTLHHAPSGPAGYDEEGSRRIVYYGCGWSIRHLPNGGVNRWHNGLLDGTASLLVVKHDGMTWAALFNSRNGTGEKRRNLGGAIDSLLHRAASEVKQWPKHKNLFPLYLSPPSSESAGGPSPEI